MLGHKRDAMKVSIRALLGEAIVAQDGAMGFIADVYFEDARWTVRYLVVDTGHPMPRREVLLSPALIAAGTPDDDAVRVRLRRAEVERCPDADTDRPVYRQYGMAVNLAHGDEHLRSAKVVMGYGILTLDGDGGRVEDLFIDRQTWAIVNVVVSTGAWLAGKRVLVAPGAVQRIDRPERKVRLRMMGSALRALPGAQGVRARRSA